MSLEAQVGDRSRHDHLLNATHPELLDHVVRLSGEMLVRRLVAGVPIHQVLFERFVIVGSGPVKTLQIDRVFAADKADLNKIVADRAGGTIHWPSVG